MASSSPNRLTGRRLDTAAKQHGIRMLWLGASPSPPIHDGNGCCVALSILFDPRRTSWNVTCGGVVVSVPKRIGLVLGPAAWVAV